MDSKNFSGSDENSDNTNSDYGYNTNGPALHREYQFGCPEEGSRVPPHPLMSEEQYNRGLKFVPEETPCPLIYHYLGFSSTQNSDRTLEVYGYALRDYTVFLAEHGETTLSASREDVIKFLEHCGACGNVATTINHKRLMVKGLYKYLGVHTEYRPRLDDRALYGIDAERFAQPDRFTRRPLNREELDELVNAADTYRDRLIIWLLGRFGARNADLRKTEVDDVDLENGLIEFPDFKSKRNGGRSERKLDLGKQDEALLRRWIEVERSTYPNSGTSDYLFLTKYGKRFTSSNGLADIVKQAAEEAGLQKVVNQIPLTENQKEAWGTDKDYRKVHWITPHTLRHTFVYLLKESDHSLEEISELVNHNSTETTKSYGNRGDESDNTFNDDYLNDNF